MLNVLARFWEDPTLDKRYSEPVYPKYIPNFGLGYIDRRPVTTVAASRT